jgi:hypothetical protein
MIHVWSSGEYLSQMTALGKILNLGTRSDHLDSKSRLKKKKKKKNWKEE